MPLLWPTVSVHKITDITAEQLHAMGIKALILDADDTLSGHGEQVLFPGVETWLASMKASGCAMLIASNNFKERYEPFAKKLGLPFISHIFKTAAGRPFARGSPLRDQKWSESSDGRGPALYRYFGGKFNRAALFFGDAGVHGGPFWLQEKAGGFYS